MEDAGREQLPDGDAGEETLKQELDKLWDVCNVLGIRYEKKLSEFGPESEVTEERVQEAVRFLTVSRDANFRKLKEIAEAMIQAWQLCNSSRATVENFSWIFLIKEAENAGQIIHWDVLSTESVKKAAAEVDELMKDREIKIQKKYNLKKSKFKKMLSETHLTANDVNFDMNVKFTTGKYSYKAQKNNIKDAINELKELSVKRKELVVKIEIAKKIVRNNKLSSEVKKAERMNGEDPIPYDGQTVDVILKTLRDKVDEPAGVEVDLPNEPAGVEVVEATEVVDPPRSRSGRPLRKIR